MAEKLYVLYDSRAAGGDTDDALVECTARTLTEARRDKRDMFPNAVIYVYDVVCGVQGEQLVNEARVWE